MRITCRLGSDTPILSQSLLLCGLSNLASAPAKVSGELEGTSTYGSRVTVKRINQAKKPPKKPSIPTGHERVLCVVACAERRGSPLETASCSALATALVLISTPHCTLQ